MRGRFRQWRERLRERWRGLDRRGRRRVILGGVAVLVVLVLIWAFLPDRVPVQTAHVTRGPLQVTVEEEGETEVADRYVVTAPVTAYMRRIELEVGDKVETGQALVELEPPRPQLLDPRTRAELVARAEAAEAAVVQAMEQARSAEAVAVQAASERDRLARLAAAGAATPQALEQATAEAAQAAASADAARAAVETARGELAAAQAALRGAPGMQPVQQVLRAPAAGRILTIHRTSAGHVSPGEPLIEIGSTAALEVRIDVLSQDAVRIAPGMRVLIDQWGGPAPLEAVVRRIEPQGFTVVSPLGVEEQRVAVTAVVTTPPAVWQGSLGAGYGVLARFIIWEGLDVLRVPTGALFRVRDGWAVFVVESGRANRRDVVIGWQAGLAAEVLEGLVDGEEVVMHPGNDVDHGVRVRREN